MTVQESSAMFERSLLHLLARAHRYMDQNPQTYPPSQPRPR